MSQVDYKKIAWRLLKLVQTYMPLSADYMDRKFIEETEELLLENVSD